MLQLFNDEKDGNRNYFQAQKHGEESAVLDDNNVNAFYNDQVAYIERWIEIFTIAEGTGTSVNHCIQLYLRLQNMNLLNILLVYLYQRY